MKKLIFGVLAAASLDAMGDPHYPSYYDSEYGSHSNYTGRKVSPPQPMYYNEERLRAMDEQEQLREINAGIQEQNDLKRQELRDEEFSREVNVE